MKIAHAYHQLYFQKEARIESRRAYARDYYAEHREELLEKQRQYRAAQRARDPERYKELRRGRAKRWRDGHKERENAKGRAKYRANPHHELERRAKYYAENAEEIKARRRARYAENREKELAKQTAWRDREKRRRELGLPVRRLHVSTADDVAANDAAANAFFAQTWGKRAINRMVKGPPTPPELLAAFKRQNKRIRAATILADKREVLERLEKELGRTPPGPKPKPRRSAKEIEEERLDAIGKRINDQLRHREPPRRPHHLDPAAPHPMLQPNHTMGMNR
ncbi:hypothetical protein [Microbacterium sp. LWO13-1.2]|uniref:hypothetical protein n=1 Tax=Microbacterium sp. LWO13-1.2 TaxID=3135262 RepID=UPI00313A08E3